MNWFKGVRHNGFVPCPCTMAGPSPFSAAGQLTHLYCCSIPEHSCVCTLYTTIDGGMLCVACKPPMQRRRNHSPYQLAYIMFTAVLHVPALVVNRGHMKSRSSLWMVVIFCLMPIPGVGVSTSMIQTLSGSSLSRSLKIRCWHSLTGTVHVWRCPCSRCGLRRLAIKN